MRESPYRWVIVAAGGLLGCVAIGSMFSLPVLLQPIARDTGWSVTGVSSAMTIGFLAMAFGSMAWGGLSDRFGPARGRHDRRDRPGAERGPCIPGDVAARVSVDLRAARRRERGRHHRADDGLRHRLVRHASKSRGVARLGGHGHGADDDGASGRVAGFNHELADDARNPGDRRRRAHDPGGAAGAPPAGARRRQRRAVGAEPQSGMSVGEALRSPQFIVLRADQLLLLRDPFRPDLPYRELRADLRHSAGGRRLDLQRRGPCGHGRADRFRASRRPVRRQARSGPRPAGAGVRRARLRLRPGPGRVLYRRRCCSASSMPASCRSMRFWRARTFRCE